MALKKSQKSLKLWTKQDWRTKSGKPSTQGKKATGERYLPAKAIKARAHLHLGQYGEALSNAKASFESAADNMSYTFGTTQQAGWWRFNDGRTGDIEFHPTLRAMMTDLNDTDRLGVWDQTVV